jgi:signal transduction histidine kinase/ActR/RegA family two-component response regulator
VRGLSHPHEPDRRPFLSGLSLGATTALAGAALGILIIGAFAAVIAAIGRLDSAADQTTRSERVIATANLTEKLLLDLETGERGFVIAGRPEFLQPFERARRSFPSATARLVRMSRHDSQQSTRARAIERDGRRYLREWAIVVIATAQADLSRGRRMVAGGEGKRQVDALRRRFDAFVGEEERASSARSLQAREAASHATTLGVAGLAGSALLIVLFVAFLRRAVSVPVRRVAQAADRLAQGDRDARAPTRHRGELRQLAGSFNAMADSLAARDEQLRVQHRRLESACEEAERERGLAQRAGEEAQRANLAKSEFLSRMSHELRTPLNSVLGFAQLLDIELEEPAQRESAHHIERAGRHLLDLINEVLDLSRVESGNLPISLEPVLLGHVVGESVSLIGPFAEEHGVTLISDLGDAEHWCVLADRQRLTQVMLNLLSNAVKYNRAEGTVTVSVRRPHVGRIVILVADQGNGISADQLEHLFTPFERLGAEDGKVEGTGLGLALSHRVTEAMGGTLSLDSSVGQGSTFTVELPQAAPPAALDTMDLPQESILPRTTILYVEDNLSNVRLLEAILAQQRGVKLVSAMHGRLGLDLARREDIDVVLLDLHLPDMTGIEVLRRLKADPRTRDLPVIVLSADATDGQIRRLLAAGAAEYLTKPLDVRGLIATVGRAIDGRVTTE